MKHNHMTFDVVGIGVLNYHAIPLATFVHIHTRIHTHIYVHTHVYIYRCAKIFRGKNLALPSRVPGPFLERRE